MGYLDFNVNKNLLYMGQEPIRAEGGHNGIPAGTDIHATCLKDKSNYLCTSNRLEHQ